MRASITNLHELAADLVKHGIPLDYLDQIGEAVSMQAARCVIDHLDIRHGHAFQGSSSFDIEDGHVNYTGLFIRHIRQWDEMPGAAVSPAHILKRMLKMKQNSENTRYPEKVKELLINVAAEEMKKDLSLLSQLNEDMFYKVLTMADWRFSLTAQQRERYVYYDNEVLEQLHVAADHGLSIHGAYCLLLSIHTPRALYVGEHPHMPGQGGAWVYADRMEHSHYGVKTVSEKDYDLPALLSKFDTAETSHEQEMEQIMTAMKMGLDYPLIPRDHKNYPLILLSANPRDGDITVMDRDHKRMEPSLFYLPAYRRDLDIDPFHIAETRKRPFQSVFQPQEDAPPKFYVAKIYKGPRKMRKGRGRGNDQH